eukprot:TRINITY_DN65493_c0_g1_i1.p1 TRINITY_DN65493_c0_g1~~TRINITY_DN65493_c0_g1_i1.p1  ORF type:complete len:278 (+),score=51.13 TRINITY_DN65493_c0_g1_i1:83-916(+)
MVLLRRLLAPELLLPPAAQCHVACLGEEGHAGSSYAEEHYADIIESRRRMHYKGQTSFDGYIEKTRTRTPAKHGGTGGWKYKYRDLKTGVKDTWRYLFKNSILDKHFNPLATESTIATFGSEFNFPFVSIATVIKIAIKAASLAMKLAAAVAAALVALKAAFRALKAATAALKIAAKGTAAGVKAGATMAKKAMKYVNVGATMKGAAAYYATKHLIKDHYEMFLEIPQDPVCPWPTTAACIGDAQTIAAASAAAHLCGCPQGTPKTDKRRAIAMAFL